MSIAKLKTNNTTNSELMKTGYYKLYFTHFSHPMDSSSVTKCV